MDLLHRYDSDEDSSNAKDKLTARNNSPRAGSPSPASASDSHQSAFCSSERQTASSTAIEANIQPSVKRSRTGRVTIVSECTFIRAEPHVRGNWAAHVFLAASFKGVLRQVTDSIVKFRGLLERTGYSGSLMRHETFHLSLSRPFFLQEANIDSFVCSLRDRLQFQSSFSLSVNLQGRCFVNDERTRSFWAWPVQPTDDLLSTVKHVDEVLKRYDQPLYYDPPRFHISIASVPVTVVNPQELEEKECHGLVHLNVSAITCIFGTTKISTIPLQ